MTQLFSNNAIALLATSLTPTSTSIEVQSGLGALFPQPTNGDFFLVTLEDLNPPLTREIIKVTGRVGNTLTFSLADRGQEGTTPKAWPALSTLVDHRITAETIRQAFLQPVSNGSTSDIITENQTPILVEPTQHVGIARVAYTTFKRGNKFWVSMVSPQNFLAQNFEVLTLIQGNMQSNSETVTWTKTNRLGYNFSGSLDVSLDLTTKELVLKWYNTEAVIDVNVTVISI